MYENLLVYETRARYYLLSYTQDKTRWRVLKISRSEACELDASEDPVEYSERQAAALLHTLAEGNAGLSLVHRAFGCVGAIRFLEGYYLILVKQRRQVGVLAGHPVYAVEGTEVVELCHPSVKPLRSADEEYAEKRYLRLLELVDLRRHFFFSYGYPLTCSLQRSALGGEQPGECWGSLFCWNAHLAQPLAACLGGAASPALCRWVLPLIHGSFGSLPLALCGTPCTLTLLARRSRLFAGTRYRKRGVSDAGNVANDVETEQASRSWASASFTLSDALSPLPRLWMRARGPVDATARYRPRAAPACSRCAAPSRCSGASRPARSRPSPTSCSAATTPSTTPPGCTLTRSRGGTGGARWRCRWSRRWRRGPARRCCAASWAPR